MKKVLIAGMMAACGAVWADEVQAPSPAGVASQAEQAKATATVANPDGVSIEHDKDKALFVEFVASGRLTEELRSALKAQGFKVVDSKAEAAVVYELDGAYQALRPATSRTAEVRAGEFAEKPESLKTKTGRGGSVVLSLNPFVMLFGTIFSNLGDRSGARDATNAATAGDPDGKCLAKCEGWVYKQRAVLNVTRKEGEKVAKASATAVMEAHGLEAEKMFNLAASEVSRVAGLPQIVMKAEQ